MIIDLRDERFGRLVVLRLSEPQIYGGRSYKMWLCLCDCGKVVSVRQNNLRNPNGTRSCGCLQLDFVKSGKAGFIHGESKNKEWKAWIDARKRCYNENCPKYKDYGGRGIEVCLRWRSSFKNFLDDMGKAPSKDHTLERINVNGNYEPNNCKWATQKEQANNRRNNVILVSNGESLTMQEWCDKLNIKYTTLRSRLELGWKVDDALYTPPRDLKR